MATAAIVERPSPTGAPSLPAQTPGHLDDGLLRPARSAGGGGRAVRRRAAGGRRGGGGRGRGRARLPGRRSRRSGTLHKSDAGGVVSASPTAGELEAAVRDMHERLAPSEFSVERMAPLGDGVELIVGARHDARFGPIALVGLGGDLRRDVRGRGGRPRAARAAGGRAAAPLAAWRRAARPQCAAGRRSTWPLRRRRGFGARPCWRRRARTSPRSRSIRCWRRPTARSPWTRASSRKETAMLVDGSFEGKVALVTGGGSGMGRAMALEFARLGAAVVVAGRRPEPLEETVALIADAGGRAVAEPTDVRDPEQVDAMVARRRRAAGAAGRARQQRRRQLRREGRGALAERLARGDLDRARRRLPVRERGRSADDRPGRGRRDRERDRKLRLDRRAGHRALSGREGRAAGHDARRWPSSGRRTTSG